MLITIQIKGIWKGERNVRLISIKKKAYQIKDTDNTELDNVFFLKENIALETYNQIEEVINGTTL